MKKNHLIVYILLLLFMTSCSDDESSTGTVSSTPDSGSENSVISLSELISSPTDQFILDEDGLAKMSDGFPYLGAGTSCPHTGSHIQFTEESEDYLINIYAPVDSIVQQIRTCVDLGNGNDKYDLLLKIADNEGDTVNLVLSLEPFDGMMCDSDPNVYDQFILVEEGDFVEKGTLIAKMLRPANGSSNTHIHWNLTSSLGFHCPNIFTSEIVNEFSSKYQSGSCDGSSYGETLCYSPTGDENLTGL